MGFLRWTKFCKGVLVGVVTDKGEECQLLPNTINNLYEYMRLADFLIYYMTSYYQKKHMDGLLLGSILNRAIYIAALNLSMSLMVIAQIFYFFYSGGNLLLHKIFIVPLVIANFLLSEWLEYVYIKRKRYELICSDEFNNPFKYELLTGVRICFAWFLSTIIIIAIITVLIK